MSQKQIDISVFNKTSLLIKDYTIKKRWDLQSEEHILSDDIYLFGYQRKPIKIGVFGSVSSNRSYLYIENPRLRPDDVIIYFVCRSDSTKIGKSV